MNSIPFTFLPVRLVYLILPAEAHDMKQVINRLLTVCLLFTLSVAVKAEVAFPGGWGASQNESQQSSELNELSSDSAATPELQIERDLGISSFYRQQYRETGDKQDLEKSYKAARRNLTRLDRLHHGLFAGNQPRFSYSGRNEMFDESLESAFELWKLTGDETYLADMLETAEAKQLSHWRAAIKDWPIESVTGMPEDLRKEEVELQEKLTRLHQQISTQQAEGNTDLERQLTYSRERNVLDGQFADLVHRIGQTAPDYFRLRYDYGKPAISAVQQTLKLQFPEGALIQFFAAANRYYVLVLTPTELHLDTVQADRTLKLAIRNMKDHGANLEALLAQPALSFSSYTSDAALIYERLLGNSIQWLRNRTESSITRLALVPDGDLIDLPFAALLTETPDSDARAYRPLPYLVRDFALSCFPSSRYFLKQVQAETKADYLTNFAGFAPSYQPSEGSWLLHNQEEVTYAVRSFFGNGYFSEHARESDFRSLASETGILHLAIASAQTDQGPFLGFTPKSDSLHDGRLYGHELLNLNLEAGLVVLPNGLEVIAEQRGQSPWTQLARTLNFAGTPSLIAGLWRMDDPATKELVDDYYAQLSNGLAKDLALQHAQLTYLENAAEDAAHPHFWAGMVQTGSLGVLSVNRGSEGSSWRMLVILTSIVLLIFGGYRLGKLF